MQVSMIKAKNWLAGLWSVWFVLMLILMILQTIGGNYNDKEGVLDAWGWWATTVLPIPSLIITVLVTDALGQGLRKDSVNRFLFIFTLAFSFVYWLIATGTVILAPFYSRSEPLGLMQLSHLWLGPLLGLVTALIGVFFVPTKKGESVQ
jgi:hypothetical protein